MKLVAHISTGKIIGIERLQKLRAAKAAFDAELQLATQDFNSSPEGSLINKSGSITSIQWNGDYSTMTVNYQIDKIEDVQFMLDQQPPVFKPNKTYIDPSVLNSMLHGKLLTNDEKRAVLVEQGYLPERPIKATVQKELPISDNDIPF